MFWLFFTLNGCCCCTWIFPSSWTQEPVAVPQQHLAMVGDWVCTDGAAWSFRADGTYSHREDTYRYEDGVVVGYAGAHWNLGPRSIFDDVVADVTLAVTPSPYGLPCAAIGARTCARATPASLPKQLVGLWVLGNLAMEVRGDGFARTRRGGGPWQGGALVIGKEARLEICTEDLIVPAEVVGDAFAVAGVAMTHSEPDYDETRLELERNRRATAPRRSSGGSRSRRSHDFDFD